MKRKVKKRRRKKERKKRTMFPAGWLYDKSSHCISSIFLWGIFVFIPNSCSTCNVGINKHIREIINWIHVVNVACCFAQSFAVNLVSWVIKIGLTSIKSWQDFIKPYMYVSIMTSDTHNIFLFIFLLLYTWIVVSYSTSFQIHCLKQCHYCMLLSNSEE